MPYSITYYLTKPATPSSTVDEAGFPIDGAQLVCDAESFDQAYFLDLLDRLLPEEYLRPLKLNPDSGYEIFRAQCAVAQRLSEAMHSIECGLVMLYAPPPAKATVTVTFFRDDANAGAVTILKGTLVSTSNNGRRFETITDAVFGSLDLTATATAQAIAYGYEYNVRGDRTSAGGETLPGDIDTIEVMLQSPPFGDATIRVRNESDASGGVPDWLGLHGANRGLTQQQGESADEFRLRMRQLPDTVTPNALQRLATRILSAKGIPWEYVETRTLDYLTCYDAPSPNAGTPTYQATAPTNPIFDDTLFVFDDTRDANPFRGRYLGPKDFRGGVIFAVDRDHTVLDRGWAFDDPAVNATEYTETGKPRGCPALDLPNGTTVPGALDGEDIGFESAVASFWTQLVKAKAAGISATIDYYHSW